jgi:hypothetical protein
MNHLASGIIVAATTSIATLAIANRLKINEIRNEYDKFMREYVPDKRAIEFDIAMNKSKIRDENTISSKNIEEVHNMINVLGKKVGKIEKKLDGAVKSLADESTK